MSNSARDTITDVTEVQAAKPGDRVESFGEKLDKLKAAHEERLQEAVEKKKNESFFASSVSEEWFTPVEFTEAARETFGGAIMLDPASCVEANNGYVHAVTYFTKDHDGLHRDWKDNTFVNPPYGQLYGVSQQAIWLGKFLYEHEIGNMSDGIILLSNNTSEKWFEPAFDHLICFPRKRIRFFAPGGSKGGSPTKGNAFVYVGDSPHRFIENFSTFGAVVEKSKGAVYGYNLDD